MCCALAIGIPSSVGAETLDIPSQGLEEVCIKTRSGDLEVRSSDALRVHGPGIEALRVNRRDGSLQLKSTSDSLVVEMPKNLALCIHTVSGDVDVRGDYRRLVVQSTSGDLEFQGSAEAIEYETISGDFVHEGRAELVRMTSVSGDIEVEGQVSELRTRSTSGDLVFNTNEPRRIEAQTVSGDLHLMVGSMKRTVIEVKTYSGEILIEGRGGAHIDARTLAGHLSINESRLRGKFSTRVGQGQSRISATSYSGNIRFDVDD